MNKKKIIWLLGIITLACVGGYYFLQETPTNIKFIHLDKSSYTGTHESKGDTLMTKQDNYLILGYQNNELVERQIDSFVCKISALDKYKYDQLLYGFYYYRRGITTAKEFEDNEDSFSWHWSMAYSYYYRFSKELGFETKRKKKAKNTINTKYELDCGRFEPH